MVGAITTLVSELPGAPALPTDTALISCLGIEFYQEINGNQYLLSSGNAMKIAKVF
jgi:hypothetical protein